MRRQIALTALAAAALAIAALPAFADFPERRIQVSYPWAPGAPAYVVSQIIADGMAAELGVDVAVVARPGAGGVNAIMAGLGEPADGYTIIDGYVAPLIISPLFGMAGLHPAPFGELERLRARLARRRGPLERLPELHRVSQGPSGRDPLHRLGGAHPAAHGGVQDAAEPGGGCAQRALCRPRPGH
jgi:hypothetical protein